MTDAIKVYDLYYKASHQKKFRRLGWNFSVKHTAENQANWMRAWMNGGVIEVRHIRINPLTGRKVR